ncbi:MAG: hypothetical protein GYB31_20910 [Bacteroidetes bacterium]|nr:hypothetical protein [Bacteroidota bacterium]
MKFQILLTFMLFAAALLPAQDACEGYFPFEEGTSFTMTNYNKKGKMTSTASHELVMLEETSAGMEAAINLELTDEKGKEITSSQYNVECRDGNFILDMQNMMGSLQEAYGEMDADVETSGIIMPSNLTVGQKLEDAYTKIQISSSGISVMTTEVTIENREVVGQETITTPAGTFDCMIITSNMKSKAMMVNMEFEMKEWFAEGYGMIRSETYRKGKLDSYSELTAFEK